MCLKDAGLEGLNQVYKRTCLNVEEKFMCDHAKLRLVIHVI